MQAAKTLFGFVCLLLFRPSWLPSWIVDTVRLDNHKSYSMWATIYTFLL